MTNYGMQDMVNGTEVWAPAIYNTQNNWANAFFTEGDVEEPDTDDWLLNTRDLMGGLTEHYNEPYESMWNGNTYSDDDYRYGYVLVNDNYFEYKCESNVGENKP